ncbi:beta-N-acetylglucosaminidase domain-containing protein [Streptomyces lusitanus]|uniref:Beta-N-acetylglucosaminidase domain-containing protein n=1 Tax=Streptomyces lusitanus TaxID=68232 RepID=A0ABU3JVI0_9ACTN|nr:beta-N-acetylglucosaminidase domain-containing protein [Streptomyces lusitanus]
MQLWRGRTATARRAALALAVLAGSLGAAPVATAAPAPDPSRSPAADPADVAAAGVPPVWPRPHSLRANGAPVRVTEEVAVVAERGADPYALEALKDVLREAGAHRFTDPGAPVPDGALVVRAGHARASADPLHALPAGGYTLTSGDGFVTLTGADGDGLFHAVQTLRRLVRPDGTLAAAVVRDWPATAVRGVTEGFYGTPWTHRQRLGQLDFMGRAKLNRYLYAPGDDLYRQARWREPYPAERRAEFRELAERAARNHVTLGWAVAPGQAMCFSSDDDLRALTRKLDAMWALGFRAFQVQFQDVSYSEWHCGADAERFGSGPEAAARAHAHVANAVARHLALRHPDAPALSLMPTEYYEDGSTEYRRALARELDGGVEVAWTGVGVVPRTITGRQLAEAREVFAHPLVTMDNYPVNDYAPERLFLGPYQGREPAVAAGSAALLANAMEQPEASRIPLFTAADFAWNPREYRPQESWRAAIADLAGGDGRREKALTALARNTASSVLGGTDSAYLRPPLEEFWRTWPASRGAGDTAAERLRAAFTDLRELPGRLSGTSLSDEITPWTGHLARYGEAGTAALDMLRAQRAGDAGDAWAAYRRLEALRTELHSARVTVAEGVLDPFLDRARTAYESWAGIAEAPAGSDGGTLRLPRARVLDTVTVLTDPGTTGSVEVRTDGGAWRRIGALATEGATEMRAGGQPVDAVRVVGADPERVRHVVPWFADVPDAVVELPDGRADADIGRTRTVTVTLGSARPEDVTDRLTVDAPAGVDVRVPKEPLSVPRGTPVRVPVEVTVKPGSPTRSYDVRLGFGGAARTLTVDAVPPVAGPDLARTGRARSSADETPDFPASAANDGDPATRWSSPAEDDAWWQAELDRPVRLGRIDLHWQDAHASAYRVEVSADGRAWRTAAEVHDSRGGRETLRMDEPDVRHIRVQGEQRATRYGYSLWSVEAYAVAD